MALRLRDGWPRLAWRADGSRPERRAIDVVGDERGVAALELALTLPLLAALLLGAADFALTAAKARQVEALVDAAAKAVVRVAAETLPPLVAGGQQPGLIGGGQGVGLPPLPTIPLSSLVTLPADVSPQFRLFRGCPGETGVTAATGARCTDGSPPAAFAEIEMTAPVERLVNWPGGLFPPQVSARSLVRLD